ncbi:hypothetical protein IPG41_07020 [Candidatus Peregrinibacteria bacterium]|nr:MAG: hypothetical protein IPG41_07020 [Candidatus Peregrinibacteria bacterium]
MKTKRAVMPSKQTLDRVVSASSTVIRYNRQHFLANAFGSCEHDFMKKRNRIILLFLGALVLIGFGLLVTNKITIQRTVVENCGTIQEDEFYDDWLGCTIDLAVEKGDAKYCQSTSIFSPFPGMCMSGFAKKATSAEMCETIFKPRQKTDCLERFHEEGDLFIRIHEQDSDWNSELQVGKMENKEIHWLNMSEKPSEQSILSAEFVNLEGFANPFIEVYGKTHMGNGNLYLYEIEGDNLIRRLSLPAYDIHHEYDSSEENAEKYGYSICSEVFKNGQLSSKYEDVNNDGISDLTLQGSIEVWCEIDANGKTAEILVNSSAVVQHFVWDPMSKIFLN